MTSDERSSSFWTSMNGVVTAIAGLLTAGAGLLVAHELHFSTNYDDSSATLVRT